MGGSSQLLDLHQSTRVSNVADGSRDLSTTTHSDQYLNFNSYTTHWHTRHSGPDTSHLADQICLNIAPDRVIEEKQISGALTNNGYPSGLVKWYWQPPQPIPLSLNRTHAELWWSFHIFSILQNPTAHPLSAGNENLVKTTYNTPVHLCISHQPCLVSDYQ